MTALGVLGIVVTLTAADPLRSRIWAAALVAGFVLMGAALLLGALVGAPVIDALPVMGA